MKKECRYGEWPSPITGELITQGRKVFGNIAIEGAEVYWDEMRPWEGGRSVLVRQGKEGKNADVTPQGYSVRTRVHEYGGLSFAVRQGVVYFVNDKDQRIYVQKGKTVVPLTQPGVQFGELVAIEQGLLAVAEAPQEGEEPENFLALIDVKTGALTKIAQGADFYASPALSPDGKKLAWITWNHPAMPWDETTLWCADFTEGRLTNPQKITEGKAESIFQPQWSPKGALHFVSDRSGWWNLYRKEGEKILPLCPKEAEFGLPLWVLGRSTYAFWGEQILCTYFEKGIWELVRLDPASGKLEKISSKGTYYTQIRTGEDFAVYQKGSPIEPIALVRLDFKTGKEEIISENEKLSLDPAYFSSAQPLSFPSKNGRIAHAFYYPPAHKEYQGVSGTLPPLIVKSHGGPTSNVNSFFELKIQYWTSRGFAVLDVNYGGSTGYGRAYRELLKGNWGVVDVEDCTYGANYLVERGLVDPQKLAITGGSAGGYTTLAALTFGTTFTVGASYYGVSDLEGLVKDTHKFESSYLEGLIGPYPQRKDLYEQRSPLHFAERLNCPVIFFQGREDKIVPPNQAEKMYQALKKRGISTELIIYEGEQHGFRKAETIQDSLEKEARFYLRVFNRGQT